MEHNVEDFDQFYDAKYWEEFHSWCALHLADDIKNLEYYLKMSKKENEVTTEELKQCGKELVEGLETLMEVEIMEFEKAKVEEFEKLVSSAKKCHDTLFKKIEDMKEQKPNLAEVLSNLEEDLVSLPHVLKNIWDAVNHQNPDGVKKRSVKLETTLIGLKSSFETLEDDFNKATPSSSMNEEQQAVFDKVIDHIEQKKEPPLKLFLSGTAGTGKSFVIRQIRDRLKSSLGNHSVMICGTTGVASLSIDGRTIHSVLKLPIDNSRRPNYLHYQPLSDEQKEFVKKDVDGIVLLVIDEISMLNNAQLYMIDARLREVCDGEKEFGGVNVLLMGDLLQLPPVKAPFIFEKFKEPDFWFRSDLDLWQRFSYMELSRNCRVNDGPESVTAIALGHIRLGNCFPEVKKYLEKIPFISYPMNTCDMEKQLVKEHPGKTFIILCATRKEAETVNKKRIREFPVRRKYYSSKKELGEPRPGDKGTLDDVLEIAIGAKVMLLVNLGVERGLANGSIGRVLDMQDDLIVVKFDSSKSDEPTIIDRITIIYEERSRELHYKTQFPLRLAYASTVHKAQGLTFDGVIMDVSRIFASGQFFVMLSRARDHSLCRITHGQRKIEVADKVAKEYNRLRTSAGLEMLEFNRKK